MPDWSRPFIFDCEESLKIRDNAPAQSAMSARRCDLLQPWLWRSIAAWMNSWTVVTLTALRCSSCSVAPCFENFRSLLPGCQADSAPLAWASMIWTIQYFLSWISASGKTPWSFPPTVTLHIMLHDYRHTSRIHGRTMNFNPLESLWFTHWKWKILSA